MIPIVRQSLSFPPNASQQPSKKPPISLSGGGPFHIKISNSSSLSRLTIACPFPSSVPRLSRPASRMPFSVTKRVFLRTGGSAAGLSTLLLEGMVADSDLIVLPSSLSPSFILDSLSFKLPPQPSEAPADVDLPSMLVAEFSLFRLIGLRCIFAPGALLWAGSLVWYGIAHTFWRIPG